MCNLIQIMLWDRLSHQQNTPVKHTGPFPFTDQHVLMQYIIWININWPFHELFTVGGSLGISFSGFLYLNAQISRVNKRNMPPNRGQQWELLRRFPLFKIDNFSFQWQAQCKIQRGVRYLVCVASCKFGVFKEHFSLFLHFVVVLIQCVFG